MFYLWKVALFSYCAGISNDDFLSKIIYSILHCNFVDLSFSFRSFSLVYFKITHVEGSAPEMDCLNRFVKIIVAKTCLSFSWYCGLYLLGNQNKQL